MDKLLKCEQELQTLMNYNYELENQLQLQSEEMERQKFHDPITGLLNNLALVELLKSNKNRNYFLLNVDNFGNVNNAYGYEIGNEALVKVSEMLKIVKPLDSELFRFCADKYVLVSEKAKEDSELKSIAESILSFFNASDVTIDDIPIPISFSVGISTARGMPAITQAELALKEIRKTRRNFYYIYDQKLENLELQQENVYWVNKIKESILDDDVIVHYQPIRNNHTKKIEKYECLSRIDDDGSLVSPFSFMEAAISTRALHLMTQSVIEQACKKFTNTEFEFSINVTKEDLDMNYLEGFLLKNCAKTNINPSRIVLEILEDISTLSQANILDQLNSLRFSGFQLAIDDFGAENSNFSRLLEFKPDYLKIDGAFIKNIVTDKNSRLITQTITDVCKKSDIKVIAEYVHNEEVQKIMEELGVDYSQGYHVGTPSVDLID